jgi:uncharacterized membrane protein
MKAPTAKWEMLAPVVALCFMTLDQCSGGVAFWKQSLIVQPPLLGVPIHLYIQRDL